MSSLCSPEEAKDALARETESRLTSQLGAASSVEAGLDVSANRALAISAVVTDAMDQSEFTAVLPSTIGNLGTLTS